MMENEILLFQHEEFGEVRTLDIDGEQWFVGKDIICKVFGDRNHNRSLSRVDDEDKRTVKLTDSLGRKQTATAVNESGIYVLLFVMQPQKAHHKSGPDVYPIEIRQRIEKLHRFKRWITAEVLPSIRKHGAYITTEAMSTVMSDPRELAKLFFKLADEQESRRTSDKQYLTATKY